MAQFDHEKLRAYQEALKFAAWAEPVVDGIAGKTSVRDQLERAATSVSLNIAEGNGKRSIVDRCRYLDSARGSALECAACLDLLVVRGKLDEHVAQQGKQILLGVVSMIAGLIGRFRTEVSEDPGMYPSNDLPGVEHENDYENEKDSIHL